VTGALRRGSLRGTALLVGLAGYGFSMAMMVRSELGLDPWDVFHQGLALHTGMTIGIASAVVGVAVLLAWSPLRNRPGVGTIANVVVIAITVDLGLLLMQTPTSMPVRIAMMVGAVVLNAFSTVLYVGAGLGPGPRDGLMTGLVVRTGLSVRLVRIRHRSARPILRAHHAQACAGRERLVFGGAGQRFGRADRCCCRP
jgi:uncharacterized membrane protein YczE